MLRGFVGILLAAAAAGQTAPEPLKVGPVTVSGSLRLRMESWDWFSGAADNNYTYLGSLFRVSLRQSTRTLDWQLEFAAPVLIGLPDNAIAPGAQGQFGLGANYFGANGRNTEAGTLFLKQGYIRFKGLPDQQTLKLGRMEFIDGGEVIPHDATLAALKRDRIAHRLLGNYAFSQAGRSFDGVGYAISGSKLNFTAFGARPTRGVYQVDGWGDLNANVFYGALTGEASAKSSPGEWRLFGLGYSDYRDNVLKTDNRALAARRADIGHIDIGTFGGHYIQNVTSRAGVFDTLFWGVVQTGSWGNQRHRANALAVEAGWQPTLLSRLKPWLRAGYDRGSGDKNPNDATHGTFFQVLPTPRMYARMPFFNLMNNRDAFGELILRPTKALTIRTDVHSLALVQKNDLWYSGGGMYQPWTFGYTGRPSNGNTGLATLYDASADYNINPHFTCGAYYGHASGKSVLQSIYPDNRNGNFGFLEFWYRF